MPGYETTVVLRPNAPEDLNAAMKSKLESIVKAEGGQFLNHEDWGSRRLAFTRQRENKGRYHYFAYTGQTSTVAEIERNLRINENVMLYLSVKRTDGDSAEEVAELKDLSAMLKSRERAKREGFEGRDGGGFGGGYGGGGREGGRDREGGGGREGGRDREGGAGRSFNRDDGGGDRNRE